ncbi:carbohydrate binding family 9 domain-containing protein [Chondromyces apiculatus]|uniref:Uncharacterized protein n=1 Tax=Chondromyces apiculatus DSM 436 TaxID=1192034 RepID=A0A017TDQ7_9BACT|nr:carbohydrate binding family 9 domain-containing protein [Chondromyces apiculatus]EYF07384.1 Hypothetical protein CAP_0137 [Chondromyces apiculatus DSM 436]
MTPQWFAGLVSTLVILSVLGGGGREARADSSYSARATRTDEPITIDGKLDDPAWRAAPVLTGWHRNRIEVGKIATDQTEVRILYDRDNLYFGFHCLDAHPEKITAYTVQNEGFLHQEDNVTVIIDTFHDHRNAYYFWTNPLGVRTDGRIVDDGEAFSTDWQGEWEAQGSIVSDGWVVEMRIPFSNFQFPDAEEHTFGLLLDREQARTQEWSNWTPDGVNSAKVSRYPNLTGLREIRGRSPAILTAYASTQIWGSAGSGPELVPNAGLDAVLSPTPWMSLKLTVNPDFAQVDIDQDVLWLDTEEHTIPERRPFFREGNDLFIAPMQIFFSRRIAPKPHDRVVGGVLAVGKLDRTAFSVLDVQSREERPDGTVENVNAAVTRVQQDLGKRSNVSALGISRVGDVTAGVAGADSNLHIYEEIFIQAQAAKSFGPTPDKGAEAFHVGVHRFNTTSEFWLQYEDIGESFSSPLGYIPIRDKQSVYAHAYYNWFTRQKALPRIDMTYDDLWRLNHAGEQTRHLRKLRLQPYVSDDLAFLLDAQIDRNGIYQNNIGTFGFVVFPNDWQSLTLNTLSGSFLGGNLLGLNGALNLKLGPRFAIKMSGSYTRNWEVPEGSPLWGTASEGYQWVLYGQLRYQFTPNLYARLTLQRGDALGIADLNAVRGQVIDGVFGWHYRLGSDVFVVYTQQPVGNAQEHRALAKVSYTYY